MDDWMTAVPLGAFDDTAPELVHFVDEKNISGCQAEKDAFDDFGCAEGLGFGISHS